MVEAVAEELPLLVVDGHDVARPGRRVDLADHPLEDERVPAGRPQAYPGVWIRVLRRRTALRPGRCCGGHSFLGSSPHGEGLYTKRPYARTHPPSEARHFRLRQRLRRTNALPVRMGAQASGSAGSHRPDMRSGRRTASNGFGIKAISGGISTQASNRVCRKSIHLCATTAGGFLSLFVRVRPPPGIAEGIDQMSKSRARALTS